MNSLIREIDNLKRVRASFNLRTMEFETMSPESIWDTLESVLNEVANKDYGLFFHAVKLGKFSRRQIDHLLTLEIVRLESFVR